MNDHIAAEAVFEHWPLDAEGERLRDGDKIQIIKELRFGRVDIAALKELEDFLRGEPLEAHLRQVEALQARSPAVAEMIVRSAVDLGDKRRIGTAEFDRAVKSVPGVSYLVYLSLRAKHPEVTPRIALKIVADAAALKRQGLLQSKLFRATGFTQEAGDDEGKAPAAAGESAKTSP